MAPAMSIRCMTVPPRMNPSGFASFGSTTCTISVADSDARFGVIRRSYAEPVGCFVGGRSPSTPLRAGEAGGAGRAGRKGRKGERRAWLRYLRRLRRRFAEFSAKSPDSQTPRGRAVKTFLNLVLVGLLLAVPVHGESQVAPQTRVKTARKEAA